MDLLSHIAGHCRRRRDSGRGCADANETPRGCAFQQNKDGPNCLARSSKVSKSRIVRSR